MTERLLDATDVGEKLRISDVTVRHLARKGQLPPGLRVGGSVRWREAEIDAWIVKAAQDQVAALSPEPPRKRRA
jgi:excisionase family DNA binding protein